MLTLTSISSDSIYAQFVEDLYCSAFPEEERRIVADQWNFIDNNPLMSCLLIESESSPVGFFTVWQFADFAYIEHFAVNSQLRNQGLGSKALDSLLSSFNCPVLLEAELPENELACRRIRFYKRHGFSELPDPYIQPPYPGRESGVPLRLMLYGNPAEFNIQSAVDAIYKEVYQVL